MALSFTSFTGDGTNRNYAVAFPYISRDHVSLTVNGTPVTFSWLSGSLIQAAVAPANGSLVMVKRTTPVNAPLVDFADASTLTESDLDLLGEQNVYLAQETNDEVTAHSLLMDTAGNFTARAKRLVNVADPTSAQDASTKAYVDTQDAVQHAYTDSRIALGQSYADAASASADNANAASAAAAASAASIAGDAAAAAASAAAALADKNTVAADKTTTLGYKNAAETAATAVAADKATTLGYKNDAAASASATATSEANAAASAAAALADKNTVAADKATTLGYKNDAAASATATATSASDAAASAAAALADKNTVAADKTTTLGYKNDAAASAAAADAAVAAAASVTDTQLALKADKASPTFTGTATLPNAHLPDTDGVYFGTFGHKASRRGADGALVIGGGQATVEIDAANKLALSKGFDFKAVNGVGNSRADAATFGKITGGSSTNPLTTPTPLVGISRTEAITTGTEGAQNAALMVESIGANTSSGGGVAMTTSIAGIATVTGYGDVVGVWGQGVNNSTTPGRYGYGGFFLAEAYHAGTNAIGAELMVNNSTGSAAPYINIDNPPKFTGAHICALGGECTSGLYIDGSSGGSFSVGALFRFNINYAAIVDTTVGTYSYKDNGSHTIGIDLTGATYSQHSIKATGFKVPAAGGVVVDASPVTVPTLKSVGATASAGAGGNVALVIGAGLLLVHEISLNGGSALYMCDSGFGVFLIHGGGSGIWVAPTTTPAAGKCSVAFDGTSAIRIYNNMGSATNFYVGQWAN
jgi:hypothetical protein